MIACPAGSVVSGRLYGRRGVEQSFLKGVTGGADAAPAHQRGQFDHCHPVPEADAVDQSVPVTAHHALLIHLLQMVTPGGEGVQLQIGDLNGVGIAGVPVGERDRRIGDRFGGTDPGDPVFLTVGRIGLLPNMLFRYKTLRTLWRN